MSWLYRNKSRVALATILIVAAAAPAAAQSRVFITVYKKGAFVNTILPGAAVCFTATNNTKITDQRGLVVYTGVPQGTWSAIGWKSGYSVKRADVTVPAGGADVRAAIVLETGTGETPCILPSPPPAPPPSPEFKLTVKVARADGVAIQGATVCVGTTAGPDLYGLAQKTTSTGRAYFYNVPREYSVNVTASADSYTGVWKTVYSPITASEMFTEIRLAAGAPDKVCPIRTTSP